MINLNQITLDNKFLLNPRSIHTIEPNTEEKRKESAAEKPSKAGQRRLRTETVVNPTMKAVLDEQPRVPPEVLELYRKYSGRSLDSIIGGGQFDDALLLLRHHLYRPDEIGQCCSTAVRLGAPLELIKLCLPDRQYLVTNPQYLDNLLRTALQKPPVFGHQAGILDFLSDREAAKNCPERDLYFISWTEHEMRAFGAHKGEYFEDLIKRKPLSPAEISLLIAKFPVELRRTLTDTIGNYSYIRSLYLNSFLKESTANYEHALMLLKYSICKPTYYNNFIEGDQATWGSFEHLLSSGPLSSNERDTFLWSELWKRTIPPESYKKAHSSELDALYKFWATRTISIGHSRSDLVNRCIEILHQLELEGVDLKRVYAITTFAWVREFLKKHNLIG